jgi:RNA polymerase sigma-70 factor, ECF subfamily
VTAEEARRAITAVWKGESARLVAGLVRIVRDVGLAEELAQDALVAALETWPTAGVPERPGAWLMTAAKNRALSAVKRARMLDRRHEALGHELGGEVPLEDVEAAIEAAMDDDLGDDVLRLVFTACHPALSTEARVALTLRLLGGLTTDEIARAFLASEPAIAQRIVRAKRTLAETRVPFEVPRGAELGARLASVLEVVYLIFNEGYAATAGDDVIRPALVEEALRLGRLLAALAPDEPEVHGLLALMELASSRARARTDERGDPVLLLEQDRARWDAPAISRGLGALATAARHEGRGPFVLQAEIAACHARAQTADETDWARIAALYGELAEQVPSPVVELNRAMAVSRADGPAAGLVLLDALASSPALARYHLLPSARADLLSRLGRHEEAREAFERAASLTDNARLRQRLLRRAQEAARAARSPSSA